jgi:hypothetical protein
MNIKYLTLLFPALLAGCASPQPPAPPKQEPQVVIVSKPSDSKPSEIDNLLAYHQTLLVLPRAEIIKELEKLELQPRSSKLSIQKAMALALLGRKGDLALAQFHLLDIVSAENPVPQNLRAFAQMLSSNFAASQRLTEQLEKTDRQLNESQRNADHLSRMLDELKAIERSMPSRRGNGP